MKNYFLLIMIPLDFEILSTNILSGIKSFSKYKSDKIILACNRAHDLKIFKKYHVAHVHSSEIRGLCLMKCSSEMLQNLPYFWHTKSHIFFLVCFSFHATLFFALMSALVRLCRHRLGHSLEGKIK